MPSLRRRVFWAFAFFALFQAVLFGFLVWGGMHMVEDLQVERSMELARDEYLERRAVDPSTPLPNNSWLRATSEASALPGPLAPYASAPDGVHEVGLIVR
ncbi:MAG: hypothetical protein AAF560_28435 [Acidobacteriota bacterium]